MDRSEVSGSKLPLFASSVRLSEPSVRPYSVGVPNAFLEGGREADGCACMCVAGEGEGRQGRGGKGVA